MANSKRGKSKYPALSKGLNLKSRKDYIEPDYINGVKNQDGEVVIRPLNSKEKKFLDDFYAETIITDFLHDPRLRSLLRDKQRLINNSTTRELRAKIKELKEDTSRNHKDEIIKLKQTIKLIKEQNTEDNQEEINEINEQMQEVREEVLLYKDKEDHKKFYNDNNSRNSCIYNRSVMMNKMMFIDSNEYDFFSSSLANKSFHEEDLVDYEDKLIDFLERDAYEEEEVRLKEVLKEEEELKKKV